MISYDEEITENIKRIDEIYREYEKLANALDVINKTSDKTYGISLGFKPKKGIYYIEDGVVKMLSSLYEEEFEGNSYLSIDSIRDLEFIDKEFNSKRRLRITFNDGRSLIVD